jgi:hypothetical protein
MWVLLYGLEAIFVQEDAHRDETPLIAALTNQFCASLANNDSKDCQIIGFPIRCTSYSNNTFQKIGFGKILGYF